MTDTTLSINRIFNLFEAYKKGWFEMRTLTCKACGEDSYTADGVHEPDCPYCGGPTVDAEDLERTLREVS